MTSQLVAAFRSPSHNRPWQHDLAHAIRSPNALCALLDLNPQQFPQPNSATFPLRVPPSYLARINKGDPQDPLLRQILPQSAEDTITTGFVTDPVGDLPAKVAPGTIHKYQGRLLIMPTSVCPIHCRYCFRRHFVHERFHLPTTLRYLAANPAIHEVIVSGGDPLSLSNQRLATLLNSLTTIPHLKRLRIHTRMPIVLPQRIDDGLLTILARLTTAKIMVLHSNHRNELNSEVQQVCAQLARANVTLLNQSVLLRGVNDTIAAQRDLAEALCEMGVIPYYLHLLDPVQGAQHFNVTDTAAVTIIDGLRVQLPGYLVPRLVRELAGAPSKITPLPGNECVEESLI